MAIFLAVLGALLLEHFRPLSPPLPHYRIFAEYAGWLRDKLDGGEAQQGMMAWSAAVLPPLLAVFFLHAWLAGLSPLLGAVFDGVVLYFTAGFKYYARAAEAVAAALAAGELAQARQVLARWGNLDTAQFGAPELARVGTEQVLALSHRQLFGALLWFFALSFWGPVGALLYRLASILARRWGEAEHFGQFARQVFHWLNWPAARLTALSFAVAGDFEDAIYCWRTQAADWPDAEEGIVLAAGAGALGVHLGLPLALADTQLARPELGLAEEADAPHIDSAVSLVWRGLAIWLVLAALFVVAGWAA